MREAGVVQGMRGGEPHHEVEGQARAEELGPAEDLGRGDRSWLRRLRTGDWWLLAGGVGLTALVYGLFSPRLYQSLTLDEAYSYYFARAFATLADDTWPPLYYGLLWLARRLGAESEPALRLPSVVAAIAAAIPMVLWGRRLLSPRIAVLAAVGLVISPVLVRYAYWARGYSLLVCLSAVVVGATATMAELGLSRPWLVAWMAGCALAAMTHHFGALLALASYLTLVLFYLSPSAAARLHRSVLGLWLCLAPLLVCDVRQLLLGVRAVTAGRYIQVEQILKMFGPGAGFASTPLQTIAGLALCALVIWGSFGTVPRPAPCDQGGGPMTRPEPTPTGSAGAQQAPYTLWRPAMLGVVAAAAVLDGILAAGGGRWPKAAALAIGISAAGGAAIWMMSRLTSRFAAAGRPRWATLLCRLHPLATLFLVMVLVSAAASAVLSMSTPHYYLVLFPAYWLLAGRGLMRLSRRWQAAGIAVIAIAFAGSYIDFAVPEGRYGRQADWRGAIRAAIELRKPGDLVSIRPVWGAPTLSYYGVTDSPVQLDRGDELCAWPAPSRTVVVVSALWHHVYASPQWQQRFQQAVARCAEVLDTRDLSGVRVQRLRAPPEQASRGE